MAPIGSCLAATLLVLLLPCSPADAEGYRALVHVPANLELTQPAPLVVALHACNQTAEQFEAAAGLDAEADANRFVVLYPDYDPLQRPLPCWRFRSDTRRSSADPRAVATMVRDAIARRQPPIDPTRVYVAGLSSGAMMTVVLGATYPDLFAGIAVTAGCAYRAMTCLGAGPSRRSATLAREALAAMGPRKRILPVLIIHGEADTIVPFAHARQLVEQWRITDNLVASGTMRRPIVRNPARVQVAASAGGEISTVESYADAAGNTIIERWAVRGMGHRWFEGEASPTERQARVERQSARLLWAFFRRFAR